MRKIEHFDPPKKIGPGLYLLSVERIVRAPLWVRLVDAGFILFMLACLVAAIARAMGFR
jgi:hypothetical protein